MAFVSGMCSVLVLGGVAAGVSPAAAASCDPENQSTRGDIDGDGATDVVVGMPYYQDGSGAVDVRGTASPPLVLRAGTLGVGTGEGDGFGSEIAVGDLDGDGCADLVIGAGAEGQSAGSDGAGNNEGQVHIVFGGAGGLDTSTQITLPHDSSNLDHFGTALALTGRTSGTTTTHDLFVGAPDAAVGGKDGAGEVFRYTITPDPVKRVVATLREVRSQDSAGVPGSAEAGDGFGTVIAAADDGRGVLVGAPNEDLGTVKDAGAIWFLRLNAAGAPIASTSWSQDSPGVSGAPERGDHFGAAVASRADVVVVGVPDEDSGTKADSGMVQTFAETGGLLTVGRGITQDTAGVPGAVEAGDRFGTAVLAGQWFVCQEAIDLAVGAPGEDIGSKADAGTIALVSLTSGCSSKALRQGSGLAGAAETGDGVGSVLGLTRGDLYSEEDYADRLLVGVPLEDLGASADAGMVVPARGGINADGVRVSNLQFSGGYLNADHYGQQLSTPSD